MDNLCDSLSAVVGGYGFECDVRWFHPLVISDCASGVASESDRGPKAGGLTGVHQVRVFTLLRGTGSSVGEGLVCLV